ncbi:g4209 [Coccomyxa viridis]|uniref:G4209 protein n=1 Tax=Coccomyxa viridis TaxID=1274662 RepID=A0ABP1FPQ9_9CHLO
MSGDNSLGRRKYSSANDLTTPLVSASSDAHCLPAVKGLERRRSQNPSEQPYIPRWIIDPDADWYCVWWGITIAAAGFTGFYEPWVVSFLPHAERYSPEMVASYIFLLLHLLFSVDILISFRVAFQENETLVTDPALTAKNYRRTRFWWDLAAWIPWDYLALLVLGDFHAGSSLVARVPLLRLLRLIRLYRVRWFFEHLEYNLTLSLLWVTLVRNLVYVLYVTHWSACTFYFIASQYGLDQDTWIGRHFDDVVDMPIAVRYIFALYWAITTLATVGYGDLSAANPAEAVWATIYMFFNLALGAYVLGTITLIVIKHDERTGRYRDLTTHLKDYIKVNEIPPDLNDSMQSHLRLHFNNEEASDEQVLVIFPTTIRRRILRHLYLRQVRMAYLFKGVRQKFIDAILGVARIELFMPQVEILSEGDSINELMILVGGMCEILRPGLEETSEELSIDIDGHNSIRGGYARSLCGGGDALGEVAFFTEIAQLEMVRTVSVCRILVVPRIAYNSIAAAFPIGARAILTNLLARAQEMVQNEFRGRGGQHAYNTIMLHTQPSIPSSLKFKWAAPEMVEGALYDDKDGFSEGPKLQSVASEASLQQFRAAGEEGRPGRPPRPPDDSASSVKPSGVRGKGKANPNKQRARFSDDVQESERPAAAYEPPKPQVPQTPFAEAAAKGPPPDQMHSSTSSSPRSEAGQPSERGRGSQQRRGDPEHQATNGSGQRYVSSIPGLTHRQEQAMANLLRVRTVVQQTLARQDAERTNQFLHAASSGDVAKIRQMLQQGFAADSADYDGRTALMLASVKGHADVAVALISAGADVMLRDNLKRNPLLEACVAGHSDIIELLTRQGATLGREQDRIAMGAQLCTCVFEGNLPLLRRLIRAGAAADAGDYDKRTALHIAAAEGNTAAMRLLVEEGGAFINVTDRWGNTPLDEANRAGARPCAAFLERRIAAQQRGQRQSESSTPLEESSRPLGPLQL